MATFNEADRDQYGGDIAIERSTLNIKTGQTRPLTRKDIGHPGILFIGRGDLVCKKDPHKRVAHRWIELDEHTYAMEQYINAINEGYQFATTDEFSIRPSLQQIWRGNTEKIITLGGKDKGTLAIMWIDEDAYDQNHAKELRLSDSVDRDLAEKMRAAAEQINRSGDPTYRIQDTRVDLSDEVGVEKVVIR